MFACAGAPSILSCWGGSVELERSLVLVFAQSVAHELHSMCAPHAARGVVETRAAGMVCGQSCGSETYLTISFQAERPERVRKGEGSTASRI